MRTSFIHSDSKREQRSLNRRRIGRHSPGDTPLRSTVLGAAGGAGRAITHELAARGHEVTAASRSATTRSWPHGVTSVATDLDDRHATRAACRDAEVVVMAAQVPYSRWYTELPDRVERAADAAGGLRVTIGRFADYYGPFEGNSLVNQLMLEPGAAGKRVRTFIADDQPHTFHYLPDVARGFATLVERPEADGRVWILPAAQSCTQAALLDHLDAALDAPVRRGRVSPAMLWMIGLCNAELRAAREVVPQFDRAYEIDASAFDAAFGPLTVTPHAEAIATTAAWMRDLAAVPAAR